MYSVITDSSNILRCLRFARNSSFKNKQIEHELIHKIFLSAVYLKFLGLPLFRLIDQSH